VIWGQFGPVAHLKAMVDCGVLIEWQDGNTEEPVYSERTPVSVPLCPPQDTRGLPWKRDGNLKWPICQCRSLLAVIYSHHSCYVNAQLNQMHCWTVTHIVPWRCTQHALDIRTGNYAHFRVSSFSPCAHKCRNKFSSISATCLYPPT
jgi:hypothetical protein